MRRFFCWASCATFILAGIATAPSNCFAQEVASIDLTKVEARLDLRRPKASSEAATGYSGTQSTGRCFDSDTKTGALDTSLLSLDRTQYQVGDEPKFEVTLQNTGSVPVKIPTSAHLADLQPKDPAKKFAYIELQITLWIAADKRWSTNMGGSAILYGDDNHAHTMIALQPGEWIRIIAKGDIRVDEDLLKLAPAGHAYAEATLFQEETLITSNLAATAAREVCVAQTHRQTVPIQLSMDSN